MTMVAADNRMLLVGCGILQKEIRYLIQKNNWEMDTFFIDSALHCDLFKLKDRLQHVLQRFQDRNTIVFYGTCHPLMDFMLQDAHTVRTLGQNCAEILLGKQIFTDELANGAFFLLEDWAKRWEQITYKTFGTHNLKIIREIYRGDRKYMLCLKTPCSDDFTALAETAGAMVDIPIRWMDVPLNHLQSILENAICDKRKLMYE